MAEQQNFRTAFNGFNREDVVRYIEYLSAKHTAEVNQLNSELDFLRKKLAQNQPTLQQETPVAAEPVDVDPVIEQQAARIRELFDENKALTEERDSALAAKTQAESDLTAALDNKLQLEARLSAAAAEKSQAETLRDAALAEKAQSAAELAAALQQQSTFKSRMEEELEAYRRAERTERLARERAEQLYRQANGALADATVKVDDAATQIGELTDRVMTQLGELQTAVTNSKQALRDAAATMYTIRPSTEAE